MKNILDIIRAFLWSLWGDLPSDTDEVIDDVMRPPDDGQDLKTIDDVTTFFVIVGFIVLGVAMIIRYG